MPEPLSIFGAIGTIAGLVGFAVATIPKLHQFQRDFKGTKLRREWYQTQLNSTQLKLMAWKELWCDFPTFSPQCSPESLSDCSSECSDDFDDDFSDGYSGYDYDDGYENYYHFWGKQGYESVKTKLRLIMAELAAIGPLLYDELDSRLRGDIDADWRRRGIQLTRSKAMRLRDKYATLKKRFVFGLFRGQELEERVNRLLAQVKDLETFSQDMFAHMQLRLPEGEKLEVSTLDRLRDRKNWMEKHEQILAELYRLSSEDKDLEAWSLVFTCLGQDFSIDQGQRLNVYFDVEQGNLNIKPPGVVLFCCSNEYDTHRWYYKVIFGLGSTTRVEREGYLNEFFSRQYDGLNSRLVEAAIDMVNWTMLLWKTPWTNGICTCRLRFVKVQHEDGSLWRAPSFTGRRWRDLTSCMHLEAPPSRKALLLGVSLAEFAIKQVVTVDIADPTHQFRFRIRGYKHSEPPLLEKVFQKSSYSYREAVRHCFRYDRELANGHEFRPHHFLLIQENVIKKLETHRKGLILKRQRT